MKKKQDPTGVSTLARDSLSRALPRRDALMGLGVLALSGCSSSDGGVSGTGGMPEATGGGGSGGTNGSTPTGGTSSQATGGSALSGNGGNTGGAGPIATGGVPAAGGTGGVPAAGGTGTGGSGTGGKPMFDDAASCTLTTTDIEGPFLIEDGEIPNDPSLIRSDIREGLPGCEFRLYFRLLNARKQCAPIAGAEAYIWHCNADGLYSGFAGQDPTKPYSGPANPAPQNLDRFCRGIQTSDAEGIVSFVTLYPGWYAGRPIHIHLMARMPGAAARLITTQLYFPAAFTTEVHESEPAYQTRASAMPAGSRNPPTGKPATPTLVHTPGLIVGTLNSIVNGA